MKRTTAEDGESRVQVACRRSSRLAPSLPSNFPDLVAEEVESSSIAVIGQSNEVSDGGVLTEMMATASAEEGDDLRREEEGMMVSSFLPDLSPIAEDERLGGSSSSVFSGSTMPSPEVVMRPCLSAIDAGGHELVSSLLPSSMVASTRGGERIPGLGSAMDAVVDTLIVDDRGAFSGSAECDRVPVDDDVLLAKNRDESCGKEDGRVAVSLGENRGLTTEVVSVELVSDGLVRLSSSSVQEPNVSVVQDLGGSAVVDGREGRDGQQLFTSFGRSCSLSLYGRDTMVTGGGLVSEEVAVPPEAGAALRPQPTDGLRQSPLSPAEPAVMAGHLDFQCRVLLSSVFELGAVFPWPMEVTFCRIEVRKSRLGVSAGFLEGFESESSPVLDLSHDLAPKEGTSDSPVVGVCVPCGGPGICSVNAGDGVPVDGVIFDGGLCEDGDAFGVPSAATVVDRSSSSGQSSSVELGELPVGSKCALAGSCLGSGVPIVT
ncbi:hypothetical protein Dimus_008055 [Dionaea muscipula]